MSSTVLYVDDEPQLPDRVDELLAQTGFTLVHTSSPDEALRIACAEVPALVLIDVLIESCDGFELLEDVAYAGGAGPLPVVVVTRGERTPTLYGRALELGVDDFLCKPVTTAQVLEAVLEFARQDEPITVAPAAASSASVARSMPPPAPAVEYFEGDLAKQPLAGLFGRLHRVGASGALRLEQGRQKRAIQFRNGSPVEVERHRDLDPIADHLRRTGRIDDVQYEMLVDQLMARVAGPLEILLGMGALTEAELTKAMREQAVGMLEEMFGWTSGRFSFDPDGQIEPTRSLDIGIDPIKIILAALKQTPEALIREALDQRGQRYASYVPAQAGRLDELGLSSGQRRHIEGLMGETTVADILASKKIGARTLYCLYAMGAVDLVAAPVLMLEEVLPESEPEVVRAPPVEASARGRGRASEAPVAAPPEPALEPSPPTPSARPIATDPPPPSARPIASDPPPAPEVEISLDSASELEIEIDLDPTPEPEIDLDPTPEPEPEPEISLDASPESEPEIEIDLDPTPEPDLDGLRSTLPDPRRLEPDPAPPVAASPEASAQPLETGSIESTIDEMVERLDASDDFELFGIDESSADSAVRAAYDRMLGSLEVEGLADDDPELDKRARDTRRRLDQAYQRVRTAELRKLFSGLRKKKRAKPAAEAAAPKPSARETGSRAVEAESWFRTGEGHLEHNQYAKAAEAFGMAVHLDPTQGDYAAYLGYSLYRSNPGNSIIRREALEHVAKGVKLAPRREKPLLFLSRIFRETGETASAAKVLRRALKANPDSPALVQEMCMIDPASSQSKRKKLLDRFRRK